MTQDAFAVGVTAALDPIDDANSDMWIWHKFFEVAGITTSIADGVNAQSAVVRQEIDSKAMRKGFDIERVLVLVTEVIEVGAATMTINGQSRVLVKT